MGDNAAVQHANGVLRTINGGFVAKAGFDEAIRVSWQRCLNDFRLDPARLHAPSVIDSNNLKDLQERHDELVEIARAEIDTLYDQISGSGYALLLTDAKGIILTDKVDPTLNKMFRSAGLLVGAEWSEQSEGTNGIGTCIAEGRSITIHRNDHFRARHIGLSCSGSPIRDLNGELIAVLDASSVGSHDTRASQMHTMALVNTSARMIEKCLFLRRCQPYRVLRFHSRPEFVNLLHDAALALSEDGHIVAADDMAVSLLSAPNRASLIGRPVSELFDIGEMELAQLINTRMALMPVRDQRYGRRFFVTLAPPQLLGRIDSHSDRARRPQPERVQIAPAPSLNALSLADLAGQDPQMLQNIRAARRLADTRVPILIQGPTGSGKEVFAKAVHLASSRAANAFVAVNCAAIPETLIESELFGYKSGAFTGARKEGMRGRIQQSSGGTLFLDEIGDMPLNLQTRLLRVLEEQEVVPLGCEQAVKVELCVLSASHRDLRDMIANGTFREDLYYRLNGMTLELPALKDRGRRRSADPPLHRARSASRRIGIDRGRCFRMPAGLQLAGQHPRTAQCHPHCTRDLRGRRGADRRSAAQPPDRQGQGPGRRAAGCITCTGSADVAGGGRCQSAGSGGEGSDPARGGNQSVEHDHDRARSRHEPQHAVSQAQAPRDSAG